MKLFGYGLIIVVVTDTSMAARKVDMKTVLLGKEYTGKTCLVQRYLHERFNVSAHYQSVCQ